MSESARNAAVLVAGAFLGAGREGLPAEAVEVFFSDGRLTVIVNCTGSVQEEIYGRLADRFHAAISRGSVSLQRSAAGVALSASEHDIERASV